MSILLSHTFLTLQLYHIYSLTLFVGDSTKKNRKRTRFLSAESRRLYRVSLWAPILAKKLRYIQLIAMHLLAQLEHDGQDFHQVDSSSISFKGQLYRQANYLYHIFYEGPTADVEVIDAPDSTLNQRRGVLVGIEKDQTTLVVRLQTKYTPHPNFFEGELRSIPCMYLDANRSIPHAYPNSKSNILVSRFNLINLIEVYHNSFIHLLTPFEHLFQPAKIFQSARVPMTRLPAVFTHLANDGHTLPFTIQVDKMSLDIMCESYPDDKAISMACIRPFVLAYNSIGELKLPHTSGISEHPSSDNHLNIGWDLIISNNYEILSRSHIKKSRKQQCIAPVGKSVSPTSTSCTRKCECKNSSLVSTSTVNCNHQCYTSDKSLTLRSNDQSMLHCISKSGLNLDLLANPNEVLFTLPLHLNTSQFEGSIHHLNELGLHSMRNDFTSTEQIFNHFIAHPVTVSKKDMFSLYPSETPSTPIIDLWINW